MGQIGIYFDSMATISREDSDEGIEGQEKQEKQEEWQ
jgi:hypothetical protein